MGLFQAAIAHRVEACSVDIDPIACEAARKNVEGAPVRGEVKIICGDCCARTSTTVRNSVTFEVVLDGVLYVDYGAVAAAVVEEVNTRIASFNPVSDVRISIPDVTITSSHSKVSGSIAVLPKSQTSVQSAWAETALAITSSPASNTLLTALQNQGVGTECQMKIAATPPVVVQASLAPTGAPELSPGSFDVAVADLPFGMRHNRLDVAKLMKVSYICYLLHSASGWLLKVCDVPRRCPTCLGVEVVLTFSVPVHQVV